jgi:hypothetical protein
VTNSLQPPGTVLRDPRYHDLCAFFKTMPDGQAWEPAFGDWVVRVPGEPPGVVVSAQVDELRVMPSDGGAPYVAARQDLTWLPTLDQLRSLMLSEFSTSGCFTSSFNGRAWWFSGHLMGMSVTNLTPLAEGGSAEEAAINALLMQYQR